MTAQRVKLDRRSGCDRRGEEWVWGGGGGHTDSHTKLAGHVVRRGMARVTRRVTSASQENRGRTMVDPSSYSGAGFVSRVINILKGGVVGR